MNPTFDLLIYGNIVLPEGVSYDSAVGVKDGIITAIGKIGDAAFAEALAARVVHAEGSFVLPGAVDAHVHCYSSLDEGFQTASESAAAGGVTTIIEMPYDATGMICTLEQFEQKRQQLEQQSVVDMAMLVTIHKQDGYEHIRQLAEAGACGFKVSMFNTDSFRFPRIDDGQLLDSFAVIAETGCPVGVHCENDEIVRRYIDKHRLEGSDPRSHNRSRPKVSESVAALTVMELAYETGVKLHLYHCTYPRIFQLADYFRSLGAKVTAETCTHYLTLSEDDMPRLKAKGKINPPLRTKQDVDGLWELAKSGAIDMITSDHAPWLLERKSDEDIFNNASGAPGVEHLLPVIYSEGVAKGKLSLTDLVRLLCQRPADVFGLGHRKGRLTAGYDADIVIIDPAIAWTMDERELHSSAGWSPYNGMEMQGKVTHTFVRGKTVYEAGIVVGEPGLGQFIKAEHQR
ncbi:dihydroorotase [Paenibacillus radicis (ex Gao et al. 2016)]|uniref:Allantoinase n=1 Tax=Paenibacillus radicis (ex Gao et al. 2016) TaxID=1737354 RepID=A0A917H4V3_9BACL|nr:dihydroorotase family protein [Paenibacillus radicis (ex Gao et al. 2016)]GGG67124.1 allantoinase [Paenibacillus radicis (ex Gao et al. 2016)]